MNVSDMLDADGWIKRAFRTFAVILCVLFFVSLGVHAPFGPFLVLGAFCFVAYRVWTVRPERTARRQERNTGGPNAPPVLPGGPHQ